MGAIFGLLGALLIGISDLFGRRVVARSSATTAAAAMQFVAIFAGLASMSIVPSEFIWRDFCIGAVAGLGTGTGLACYYGGVKRSSSTVVAPFVATLSSIIPFSYTLITGAQPSLIAIIGSVLAFGGLVLVTMGGGDQTIHIPTGIRWGLASGIGYGVGLTFLIEVSAASGSWSAVSQRVLSFVLLILVARHYSLPATPPAGVRSAALVAGVFACATSIMYLLGVQADAATAVITFSMFPAFSVVIGRIFFRDPVSRLQTAGIATVLAGVAGVVGG